jgi:hypothetical protein
MTTTCGSKVGDVSDRAGRVSVALLKSSSLSNPRGYFDAYDINNIMLDSN